MKVKTPISRDQVKGVIYRIPCECGQEYIGETSKSINERIAEHRRSVRRGNKNNSIAVHVQTTDHIIKWENAEVLQREQHKTRRKIKEAMYIQTSRCMNMDQGMSLDPIWNDIIPSINTNNLFFILTRFFIYFNYFILFNFATPVTFPPLNQLCNTISHYC